MVASLSALVNPGLDESPHSAEATETTQYRKIAWIKAKNPRLQDLATAAVVAPRGRDLSINPGVFVRYVVWCSENEILAVGWSCWMGFSMQKLSRSTKKPREYITRSSPKLNLQTCSHPSTQYRNEIVADSIEVRYRLPEKHQRSTENDNTNTNSVSFRPHTIPPGHFFPFTLPRRASSLVPLSFSLFLFFLIHLLPFSFPHLHYHISQLYTISFPPPHYIQF